MKSQDGEIGTWQRRDVRRGQFILVRESSDRDDGLPGIEIAEHTRPYSKDRSIQVDEKRSVALWRELLIQSSIRTRIFVGVDEVLFVASFSIAQDHPSEGPVE